MSVKNTIFIQIASYRDPELLSTLRDCIAKAKYPKNLRFCLAWQHSPEDSWDTLEEFWDDPRFTIIDIHYADSLGACWARRQIQRLYRNEKYTLQLDSHHRFIENWDDELLKMFSQLQKKGHKKPLITGYIPSYDPANDPEKRVMMPWKMNFDRFIPEGAVFFVPSSIDNFETMTEPIPARFYSAHFAFTLGEFCKEVPHDPNYYFHGEEISIGVRAYTWGYDLFHPHKIIAWHEYTRKGRTKQWDDDKVWAERNKSCHSRNRKLFGIDNEVKDIDFYGYDFGTVRTLEDFERYAGISFKDRAIQKYTLDNHLAPNPRYETEEEYQKSFLKIFKHCINLYRKSVDENVEYDFWAIIFEDKDGNPINRYDANQEQIKQYFKTEGNFLTIWRDFYLNDKYPAKWIVWPHSKEKGWLDRIDGTL